MNFLQSACRLIAIEFQSRPIGLVLILFDNSCQLIDDKSHAPDYRTLVWRRVAWLKWLTCKQESARISVSGVLKEIGGNEIMTNAIIYIKYTQHTFTEMQFANRSLETTASETAMTGLQACPLPAPCKLIPPRHDGCVLVDSSPPNSFSIWGHQPHRQQLYITGSLTAEREKEGGIAFLIHPHSSINMFGSFDHLFRNLTFYELKTVCIGIWICYRSTDLQPIHA